MKEDIFDPSASAAGVSKPPPKKKEVKSTHLAAAHGVIKPKPASATTGSFPPPGDPYWKQHPLLTEHKDGTIRPWGEDTTAMKNPNTLPVQMLPPSTKDLSDKAKAYSSNYYTKNQ